MDGAPEIKILFADESFEIVFRPLSHLLAQRFGPDDLPPNLKLLNLSSNQLLGPISDTFGGLILLQNVSFSANSMSCSLPDSMIDIPCLVHLDLSSN